MKTRNSNENKEQQVDIVRTRQKWIRRDSALDPKQPFIFCSVCLSLEGGAGYKQDSPYLSLPPNCTFFVAAVASVFQVRQNGRKHEENKKKHKIKRKDKNHHTLKDTDD